MMVSILTLLLVFPTACSSLAAAKLGADDVVRVRYGYFDEAYAINAACGRGWLNLARNIQEDLPAYEVECFPHTVGSAVASRLDNGDLDIGSMGSAPWAGVVARGVDVKEVYINHFIGDAYGIYVRVDDPDREYVGIKSPSDLINRTIGTPFGSVMHYQLLYLIELFNIQNVKLVDLHISEIVEQWKDSKRDPPLIDGAACWGTAREHILANGGKVLISSGVLADWGAPIFVMVGARRTFADEHQRFMTHLVGILSRINDSFLDRLGGEDSQNPVRWGISEKSFMVPIVDSMMLPGETPGNPSYDIMLDNRKYLETVQQIKTSAQLTCNYMGNIVNGCKKLPGQHASTIKTAEFLHKQKTISTLGVMDIENNGQVKINDESIERYLYDTSFLASARTGNNILTAIGPYENEFIVVDNEPEKPTPDQVLAKLEELDAEAGRSPFAEIEVGRESGDSNCVDDTIISDISLFNGTIGDGANALPGKSYSDNRKCQWTIHPLDGGLIEVSMHKLRLWSGDFVRIYSGGVPGCSGDKPRTLLAQLSGMYNDNQLPDALPPFRSTTCIVVEFESDGNQERGYAVNKDYGDGFELFFSRSNVPESDCNGNEWDSDGLCICGGKSWGSDCSHNSYCIGTTRVKIEEGEKQVIQSSQHSTREVLSKDGNIIIGQNDHPYPNDMNCIYELDFGHTSFELARIDLYYDLEPTFDLLELYTGSGENATKYNVISGQQSQLQTYYVPIDENGMASLRLTTDDKGRRRGFYAEVSGDYHSEPCVEGYFGSRCESNYCLPHNNIHKSKHHSGSEYALGRVISQSSNSFVQSMPWASGGGCVWEINSAPTVTMRIIMNKPIDLEPHPSNTIGDRVIIQSNDEGEGQTSTLLELFVEECKGNEDCDFEWQTGECIKGGCAIFDNVELPRPDAELSKVSILLVTDRNDGGNSFTGVDFDIQKVQSCPVSSNSCTSEGGVCSPNDLCTCSNGMACGCSCEVDAQSSSQSKNGTLGIIIGVVCGVSLLAGMFGLWERNRHKKKIQQQQEIIHRNTELLKRKQTELNVFQLGTSKFGEAVKFIESLIEKSNTEKSNSDPSEVENLLLVKRCLIKGDDKSMHVPRNLGERRSSVSKFIMEEFAGVSNNLKSLTRSHTVRKVGQLDCLPEFVKLDVTQQMALFELLSFSSLQRWDFNIFDIMAIDQENTLLFVAWAVIGSPYSQFAMAKELEQGDVEQSQLEGYNFVDLDLDIEVETLCEYIRVIQKDYHQENPYHNAVHAADVVQTLNSLVYMAGPDSFDLEELFSIFVAAVVHDVDHPGLNNTFQVNTFSDIALNHNDAAVLENEHSAHAFKILFHGVPGRSANLNFLRHASTSKFARFRKRIVSAVLHTDMSKHFSTVAEIKSQTTGKKLNEVDENLRWDILMFMLHLADISNPAKGNPMFKLWTERCLDEFFAQGDKEKEMKLPISPNCNRDETKKPESQIGFINFVVKPAYEVLAGIIPNAGSIVLPVIENNLVYWKSQKEEEENDS